MLAFLRGVLFECDQDSAIIDVNGVGWEVQIHQRMRSALSRPGEMVTVFTAIQLSENDVRLFGFTDREELAMFKRLTAITGVGAKVAHNLVGALSPTDFYNAILSGDEKKLLSAPGVGKKMAQRLVFELKDKLAGDAVAVSAAAPGSGAAVEDLLQAMEALAYSRSEVMSGILEMQNKGELSGDLAADVKTLLKRMGGKKQR